MTTNNTNTAIAYAIATAQNLGKPTTKKAAVTAAKEANMDLTVDFYDGYQRCLDKFGLAMQEYHAASVLNFAKKLNSLGSKAKAAAMDYQNKVEAVTAAKEALANCNFLLITAKVENGDIDLAKSIVSAAEKSVEEAIPGSDQKKAEAVLKDAKADLEKIEKKAAAKEAAEKAAAEAEAVLVTAKNALKSAEKIAKAAAEKAAADGSKENIFTAKAAKATAEKRVKAVLAAEKAYNTASAKATLYAVNTAEQKRIADLEKIYEAAKTKVAEAEAAAEAAAEALENTKEAAEKALANSGKTAKRQAEAEAALVDAFVQWASLVWADKKGLFAVLFHTYKVKAERPTCAEAAAAVYTLFANALLNYRKIAQNIEVLMAANTGKNENISGTAKRRAEAIILDIFEGNTVFAYEAAKNAVSDYRKELAAAKEAAEKAAAEAAKIMLAA